MDVRRLQFGTELDELDWQALGELAQAFVTALAFVFLGLLAIELGVPLSSTWEQRLELASYLIWGVFVVEFAVRLTLATDRPRFLRSNWLSLIAIVLPAFRVLRAARALRIARSLRVARLVTTTNRGTRALKRVVGAGGIGYVLSFSLVVVVLAGLGVASLEQGQTGSRIDSATEGLWWAATTVTTLGSAYYPVSPEARALGLFVMVYGLAVSGYVTAVLAVFLLGLRDKEHPSDEYKLLRTEIAELREELRRSRSQDGGARGDGAPRTRF
ncbi:MAG: potassium channel family protein [Tepidiformaceae bacterium]